VAKRKKVVLKESDSVVLRTSQSRACINAKITFLEVHSLR
jgi:hypothetical protein